MNGLNNISPEQGRKLVELLKDRNLLRAESELFLRILKQAAKDGFLPQGWLTAQVEAGRMTQTYISTVQGPNGMFAKLETITDIAEVENILDKTPSAKIEN
jgi:hypothetical protein